MSDLAKSVRPGDAAAGPGQLMHALMAELFPLCRSITGDGVRDSLRILAEVSPIDVHEVESGTPCLDWAVPDEWRVRDAYVANSDGTRVIDFRQNSLHLVSYSPPFEGRLSLEELKPHLHTLPDQPDAIPYVTSYYHPEWGFCLSHDTLQQLPPGDYDVKIDTDLGPGSLTYGEIVIPGESDREILLATNICHPSMANNELSGPVLAIHLAAWLRSRPSLRHTYRIVFLPETIGAIVYLSRHLDTLKDKVVAGYQVVCVGGPDDFTYLRSRRRDTLADRVAEHVLAHSGAHRIIEFPERGSDERQWCSPGVDLPVGSIMRSKYHDYPEYHTSLDDLNFVRAENLERSFEVYRRCIEVFENNQVYRTRVRGGEPNLGRRGLHPKKGGDTHKDDDLNARFALLAYADGGNDLIAIADIHGKPVWAYFESARVLAEHGLIEIA